MTEPLIAGALGSVGPVCQRHETGERRGIDRGSTELADGGLSGETKGTSVLYVMRRLDWSYRQGLRSSGGGSSSVMATRQRSSARHRRR